MKTIKLAALPGPLLATAILLGGCVGAEPEPAEATTEAAGAADCENGANGFMDIPDDMSGTVRREVSLDSDVNATLETGMIAGQQRVFARLSGSTVRGDVVSMDWTQDGGYSWLQCGPFSVENNGEAETTPAKTVSSYPGNMYRACGRTMGGSYRCSAWW